MKRVVIIWCLFLAITSSLFAQSEVKFDTAFVNTSVVKFFKKNPTIEKVIQVNSGIYPAFIDIYTRSNKQNGKANNKPEEFKRYNLQFAPDIYALLKKYGIPDLPEKEISILLKKGWANYSLEATISADSILLSISFYYPEASTNPDENVFIKVEKPRGYVGGVKKLEKDIETKIRNNKIKLSKSIEDSVLAFTMIISRDSCILESTLLYGNRTNFSQIIQEFLIKSKPWMPADGGGRPAKSYTSIFIRLNRDKSMKIYFPG